MNSDFRVSVDFFVHHKTKKLKKRLGSDGIVALLQLWSYAAQFRPDGSLYGMEEEDIELAVDWPGDEGVFVHTLKTIGFLDEDDDGLRLHDWQENNPWAATSESRSDASRLSRMAKVFPNEYQALVNAGVKGITKKDYETLRTSNDRLSYVQKIIDEYKQQSNDRATITGQLLNDMSTKNNDSSTTVKRPLTNPLSPAPSPSPDPTPMVKNTPLTPQGETPDADAPASVSAQVQEAKHDAQEQPAPSPQPEPTAATQQPEQPTLSPEYETEEERRKRYAADRKAIRERHEDFATWWAEYPRKMNKKKALEIWAHLAKTGGLPDLHVLLDALAWQKKTSQWQNPQYVPHPTTYLNGRRWQDEPPARPQPHAFAGQTYDNRQPDGTGNTVMDKGIRTWNNAQRAIDELIAQGLVTDDPQQPQQDCNETFDMDAVQQQYLPNLTM